MIFNAVNDNVRAHWKTAQSGPQVFVAAASNVWVGSEQKERLRDGIDETVRNLNAVASLAM